MYFLLATSSLLDLWLIDDSYDIISTTESQAEHANLQPCFGGAFLLERTPRMRSAQLLHVVLKGQRFYKTESS